MPGIAKATASETTFPLHDPTYTYFHLQLTTLPSKARSSQEVLLDEITLRQYLSSALSQSFGMTGSAIVIDILKSEGRDAWIRVQYEDADLFVAALSQWSSASKNVSLRVLGRAEWLGGLKGWTRRGSLWSLEA